MQKIPPSQMYTSFLRHIFWFKILYYTVNNEKLRIAIQQHKRSGLTSESTYLNNTIMWETIKLLQDKLDSKVKMSSCNKKPSRPSMICKILFHLIAKQFNISTKPIIASVYRSRHYNNWSMPFNHRWKRVSETTPMTTSMAMATLTSTSMAITT